MMAVGWMAFMGSWLMNVLFYKVHPSGVDFSKKRMREKLFVHVQGEKRYLWGYKDSKGENNYIVRLLITEDTESTDTDCVSGEKSFLDKMVSCFGCCKDTDIKG